MRQEHINAIIAALNELDSQHNPVGTVRMGVVREAFLAIFEHLCQHEENHMVASGQNFGTIAERIAEQSPQTPIDQWSNQPVGPAQRNIEP